MDKSGIENKQGAATSSSGPLIAATGLTEDPDSDHDK